MAVSRHDQCVQQLSPALVAKDAQRHAIVAATAPEQENSLLAEIRTLPKGQRNAIDLFYYEEMSIREIAQLLHAKEGTVSSWLSRGRAALRAQLEKGEDTR